MSTDLFALLIAVGLGLVVVVAGWRRRLDETTQSGLPQYEGASNRTEAPTPIALGVERHQLSPRMWRVLIGAYALFALFQAVIAVTSGEDRLIHAGLAAGFVVGIAIHAWRSPRTSTR
jgi:hypothetical protein